MAFEEGDLPLCRVHNVPCGQIWEGCPGPWSRSCGHCALLCRTLSANLVPLRWRGVCVMELHLSGSTYVGCGYGDTPAALPAIVRYLRRRRRRGLESGGRCSVSSRVPFIGDHGDSARQQFSSPGARAGPRSRMPCASWLGQTCHISTYH